MFKISLCLYFVANIFVIYVLADENEDCIIQIQNGAIRGRQLTSLKGNPFYAFQEIPYAAPPIGNLRFQEPVPMNNWEGILNTTENTKICYQPESNERESEDCLHLNVYTPKLNASDLPILVYFHGGGFTDGDGTYSTFGPEFWMDYDIIIVTVNYRLGPFGFLTTEDRVIPANNGLKDQNMALKWVKNNIEKFGGDSNKVTISGESSGGASADLHMLSKRSKGLMRAAILQSGSALNYYVVTHNAREKVYQLAQIIDYKFNSSRSSKDLLRFLGNVEAKTIQQTKIPYKFYIGRELPFEPTFEDEKYEESFLVGKMYENYKEGNFNKIPTMIGFNSEEGIEDNIDKAFVSMLDDNSTLYVNPHYNIAPENISAAANELKKIYTSGRFQDDIAGYVRFMSAALIDTPISERARLQSKYSSKAPVYFYVFSYPGKLGGTYPDIPGLGAVVGHTDELGYMWKFNETFDLDSYPKQDAVTLNRMLTLWTNFVKYLNPTPEKDPLFNNVTWPSMTEDNFIYLNISEMLTVEKDPKEFKQWKAIIDKYGNPPFETY